MDSSQKKERRKTVYQLETPFSAASWPQISQEHQDVILELLCNLLEPLGQYRQKCIAPSKGKLAKKRKRRSRPAETNESTRDAGSQTPPLTGYIDIGLASVTRGLQELSAQGDTPSGIRDDGEAPDSNSPYAAVFVARAGQSSAFHCHFPQMIAVASKTLLCKQPIRLVGFSKSVADRLGASLGIPRVSSIGLRKEAPGSKALVEYIQAHVSPVIIPWLDRGPAPTPPVEFQSTRINTLDVPIGTPKEKKGPKRP